MTKFLSHSAPKQHPGDTFQCQPSKWRISMEWENLPRAVRMESSSSLVCPTPSELPSFEPAISMKDSSTLPQLWNIVGVGDVSEIDELVDAELERAEDDTFWEGIGIKVIITYPFPEYLRDEDWFSRRFVSAEEFIFLNLIGVKKIVVLLIQVNRWWMFGDISKTDELNESNLEREENNVFWHENIIQWQHRVVTGYIGGNGGVKGVATQPYVWCESTNGSNGAEGRGSEIHHVNSAITRLPEIYYSSNEEYSGDY
ncbi:hypothetical protein AgCh_015919 [Apium graveolens]